MGTLRGEAGSPSRCAWGWERGAVGSEATTPTLTVKPG